MAKRPRQPSKKSGPPPRSDNFRLWAIDRRRLAAETEPRESFPTRPLPDRDFERRVIALLESSGATIDMQANFPDLLVKGLHMFGDANECLVECHNVINPARLIEYATKYPFTEDDTTFLLIVAQDLTVNAAASSLAPNIELLTYDQLADYLKPWIDEKAKDSQRPSRPSPKPIAAAVAANKSAIMATTMGLALTLHNRIAELKERRGNSEEHQQHIDEYEELLARVEALEKAVRDLKVGNPKKLDETAEGLWIQAGQWITANHGTIMTASTQGAIFTSIVGLVGLMGFLTPYTTLAALGIATGLTDKSIAAFGRQLQDGKEKKLKRTRKG